MSGEGAGDADLRLLWGVHAEGAISRDTARSLAREASDQSMRERLHRRLKIPLTTLVLAAQRVERTLVKCDACKRKTSLREIALDAPACECGESLHLPSLLREISRGAADAPAGAVPRGAPAPQRLPSGGGILPAGGRIGPYEIREAVGAGGMGTVYRAHHPQLERDVAVKVLHPALAADGTFVARFRREAVLLARLRHPNVVPVHDVGEHDGLPYLVMGWIPGRTLKATVLRSGTASPARGLAWLVQSLQGLAAAHAAGVVHRDVKPDNLLLDPVPGGEEVRLVDFGLAKQEQSDVEISGAAFVVGTPAYMSPEQCRGEPATPQSDLYGAGCTTYFALGGTPPFRGDAPIEVMRAHLEARPERIGTVGDACWSLLERLLAKDPAQRPAGAAEAARLASSVLARVREGRDPAGDSGDDDGRPASDTTVRIPRSGS